MPCFNEEAVLPETARRIAALLQDLKARALIAAQSSAWFVDDGSADRTWPVIEQLCATDPCFHGLKLSRNYGHQNALLAGLLHAPGEVIVSLDADLQDDPGAIEAMLVAHREGAELVYGVRNRRDQDTL